MFCIQDNTEAGGAPKPLRMNGDPERVSLLHSFLAWLSHFALISRQSEKREITGKCQSRTIFFLFRWSFPTFSNYRLRSRRSWYKTCWIRATTREEWLEVEEEWEEWWAEEEEWWEEEEDREDWPRWFGVAHYFASFPLFDAETEMIHKDSDQIFNNNDLAFSLSPAPSLLLPASFTGYRALRKTTVVIYKYIYIFIYFRARLWCRGRRWAWSSAKGATRSSDSQWRRERRFSSSLMVREGVKLRFKWKLPKKREILIWHWAHNFTIILFTFLIRVQNFTSIIVFHNHFLFHFFIFWKNNNDL